MFHRFIEAHSHDLGEQIDKKTYAPGESGSVQVIFNLQGRAGAQHKRLAVTSDDHPTKPVQLYIDTTIPKSYELSAKRLVWNQGEEHVSKSTRLTNSSKIPFPIETVVSARDGISVELKPINEGFEYDLVITPSADLKSTLIPIIIHPEKPEGIDSVKIFTVYALVK